MWKRAGRAPSLRVLPLYLPYNWGKSTEKPQSGWEKPQSEYSTHITKTPTHNQNIHPYQNTQRIVIMPFRKGFLTPEDGTDSLSRNVGKELPLLAASWPRRAQFSSAPRREPEITHSSRTFVLPHPSSLTPLS